MDQETRWLTRYNEVKEFIEREHRNPSKFIPEERGLRNWVRHQQKLVNKGELKAERVEMYKELLALMEEYKRKNQYEYNWGNKTRGLILAATSINPLVIRVR